VNGGRTKPAMAQKIHPTNPSWIPNSS